MNRTDLLAALDDSNVRAFLRLIREGESNQNDDAYTICYGGSHFTAPPWEHPRKPITAGGLTSTAAGAYQFLARTYDALVKQYGFSDFSPGNQDQAAEALIHGRKALDDVISGRITSALAKCCKEWASLPDPKTGTSYYGQGGLTLDQVKVVYEAWGGKYENPSMYQAPFNPDSLDTEHYDSEEKSMPAPLLIPLFTALLPSIVNLIPALASVFKPGSEVAQRNVAAATVVANTLVEATKSPNLQAAVEAMTNDPEARAAATAAVTAPEVWNLLVDAGPGVETARKAAANPDQLPAHKNPAVWFMAAFIPLVYLAAWIVLTGETFSDDVRMMVLTAIFGGLLASGTAFFLGSSLGSQRKTTMLGGDK